MGLMVQKLYKKAPHELSQGHRQPYQKNGRFFEHTQDITSSYKVLVGSLYNSAMGYLIDLSEVARGICDKHCN